MGTSQKVAIRNDDERTTPIDPSVWQVRSSMHLCYMGVRSRFASRVPVPYALFLACIFGFYVRNLFRAATLTNRHYDGAVALALREHVLGKDGSSVLGARLGGGGTEGEIQDLLAQIAALRTERSVIRSRMAEQQLSIPNERSNSRTLMGIFVDLSRKGMLYRRKFRRLFPLHPNVCSIAEFQDPSFDASNCELIYTFVVGAWNSTDMPGQRLEAPYTLSSARRQQVCEKHSSQVDCLSADMTLLDIQESINLGKSQTWMAYASDLANGLDIDYVGKQDTDSVTRLDQFFAFSRRHLPSAPYNRHIIAGLFANKFWWDDQKYGKRMIDWISNEPSVTAEERQLLLQLEGPFAKKYGKPLRPYAQGQFYIVSKDLAEVVAQEAARKPTYLHGHEDHDVTAMAMIGARRPIQLIALAKEQRCWQHKVKSVLGKPYHARWKKEIERVKTLVREQFGADVLTRMQRRVYIDADE